LGTGALALVVVLCYLPAPSLPDTGLPHQDKAIHLVAFLAVGLAWRLGGRSSRRILALGLVFAAGIELGQALLPTGRTGDVVDALADLAGLGLGLALAPWILPWAVRGPATKEGLSG